MTPPSLPVVLATRGASEVVTAFIASVLVSVSAGIFGYYAFRNLRLNRLESQRAFWRYLTASGLTGVAYGAFAIATLTTESLWSLAARDAALLFFAVFLTFAMREIYYSSRLAPPAEERSMSMETVRRLEVGFMIVVAVEWLAVFVLGRSELITGVKALGGIAFAGYGLVLGDRLESLARGTSLDTLRRHLIPVLVCIGCLGVLDVLIVLGYAEVIAVSTKNIFVVMIAAFTITATIRLQQNVEGLTPSR